jgi:prepilin-type N-terminal cleavage/methylation domain-containing protein
VNRTSENRLKAGFTLVELLVSIAILSLLVLMLDSLFSSATTATTLSTTHSEADDVARGLFIRMSADFNRMVRRADVDYYLKNTSASGYGYVGSSLVNTPTDDMTGNDQIAFYSEVAGYSATKAAADPQNLVSLVSYRINSLGTTSGQPLPFMERMGKALSYTAADSGNIQPMVFEPITIASTWPTAVSATDTDTDYEMLAPNVFRFEYYYVLRSGSTSTVPWDTTAGSTGMNGFKDVAAIGVVIALADRTASTLIGTHASTLTSLAGNLVDFSTATTPKIGELESAWQNVVTNDTSLPNPIRNGIHIYGRLFPITLSSE